MSAGLDVVACSTSYEPVANASSTTHVLEALLYDTVCSAVTVPLALSVARSHRPWNIGAQSSLNVPPSGVCVQNQCPLSCKAPSGEPADFACAVATMPARTAAPAAPKSNLPIMRCPPKACLPITVLQPPFPQVPRLV